MLQGFVASAAILAPFWLIMTALGISFTLPYLMTVVFQLLAVSLPEEAFFRGFLQENLGNNLKGVVVVSILFSIAHLPGFIINGDVNLVLTFFPSLVMGYLYMRTSNILPCIIFHLFANIIFTGLQ